MANSVQFENENDLKFIRKISVLVQIVIGFSKVYLNVFSDNKVLTISFSKPIQEFEEIIDDMEGALHDLENQLKLRIDPEFLKKNMGDLEKVLAISILQTNEILPNHQHSKRNSTS